MTRSTTTLTQEGIGGLLSLFSTFEEEAGAEAFPDYSDIPELLNAEDDDDDADEDVPPIADATAEVVWPQYYLDGLHNSTGGVRGNVIFFGNLKFLQLNTFQVVVSISTIPPPFPYTSYILYICYRKP